MGILSEMLMHGDITATTPCAKLTCRHAIHQIGALWFILHGNSYYTVVASILVPSTASCRTKHGVKSVRSRDYSQASAILPTVTHPSHAN